MNVNTRIAVLFVALTYAASFLAVTLYDALGGKWSLPHSLAISLVSMFMPMAAAIVVQKRIYKELAKEPLGISFRLNRWFALAWLLPPVISFNSLRPLRFD